MSINTRPGFAPSIMPFSPSDLFYMWRVCSMVIMTSHCSAMALAVVAVSAPAAITSATACELWSETTRSILL